MKPDYDSLINAGLSKEEIAKISGCEDQEMQIRMLRKYRYKLLDADGIDALVDQLDKLDEEQIQALTAFIKTIVK